MASRPFRPFVSEEGVSEACDGFNECPPPPSLPPSPVRCQIKEQLLFFFFYFFWPLGVALWSFASHPAASVSLSLPRLALAWLALASCLVVVGIAAQ